MFERKWEIALFGVSKKSVSIFLLIKREKANIHDLS
jgi:hypothetical protein